ncbi:uncharacterized protein C8Q71DRAFT_110144 [Rhodofomes roseus]|uniref:Uncharacterized protein n=1 Tax=Rhodofomes roseus TaxID=34475 RepID=A0ABQ8KCC9_9APHY|nr:uncharacterized protein C8Q71DRAFT_110144 [Rhodofomes roseus]KAH9835253.1 hypothetical protein C8Q71DRAFT_110144 [Rhodofomes roseus]
MPRRDVRRPRTNVPREALFHPGAPPHACRYDIQAMVALLVVAMIKEATPRISGFNRSVRMSLAKIPGLSTMAGAGLQRGRRLRWIDARNTTRSLRPHSLLLPCRTTAADPNLAPTTVRSKAGRLRTTPLPTARLGGTHTPHLFRTVAARPCSVILSHWHPRLLRPHRSRSHLTPRVTVDSPTRWASLR